MQYYSPLENYNVNVYRRQGKVHKFGCYQGDAHSLANPTHYARIQGRRIPSDKEPCRLCIR